MPTLQGMKTWLVLAGLALMLAGCGGGGEEGEGAPAADGKTSAARVLRVIAGSEVKDVEPQLDAIARATGVRLDITYSGTLDAIERIADGEDFDAAWLSHAKYLTLAQPGRIVTQERTMLSPVILGVRSSRAKELGWLDNPDVTWRDIALAAAEGRFQYAMTNPASSNSGFSATIGVAAALSDAGDALSREQVDAKALSGFFKGQKLTAGSSGWLADTFVREESRLDGMINYESVLLALNAGGQLTEPLALIYPREGIVTADYPLVLLKADRRDDWQKVVNHLRGPEFQRWMMTHTWRRPVNPQVPLAAGIPDRLMVELPFPANLAVVDELLLAWLNEYRRPAYSIFLLDTSGSMSARVGGASADASRIDVLKQALHGLAGADQSLSGRFARFQQREIVELIAFSNRIEADARFRLSETAAIDHELAQIRDFATGLESGGGTAIYTALRLAFDRALAARAQDPGRAYSIVLMTDGANTAGESLPNFEAFYRALPTDARDIRVFPILFGESDDAAMRQVAELTGGRVFDGRSLNIGQVFKHIRGYQ